MKLGLKLGTVVLALLGVAQGAEVAVLYNGFSIRHERRQVLNDVMRLYISGNNYVDVPTVQIVRFDPDDSPVPIASRSSAGTPQPGAPTRPVSELVNQASDRHLIDADLIASVIQAESRANPRAVSPKGAQGLMQLMPETATRLGVTDPFDPTANVDAGTRYLRELLERYDYDLIRALAAYNAGPQRVEQYRGVPPYRETRAYVARIVHDFNRKKLAQRRAAARVQTARKAAKKAPARTAAGSAP